ncbi:MAG: hypothetical protein HPY83_19185 [Anaerolineae bacterium]|nr:hypothetical protein [Anaerolineae bacterium]
MRKLSVALSICFLLLLVLSHLALRTYYVAVALVLAAVAAGHRELWSLVRWRRLPPFDERVQENVSHSVRNGFAFLLIASALLASILTLRPASGPAASKVVSWLLLSGVFVYVVSYVFYDRVAPVLSERSMAVLRTFLVIAGASVAAFVVSAVLHNAVSALFGIEEPVFFTIAVLLAPAGFLVGVLGSAFLFLKGLLSRTPQ